MDSKGDSMKCSEETLNAIITNTPTVSLIYLIRSTTDFGNKR